ncbi:MAG: M23 family metallopeptidase [Mycobacteriaceae bacterium]|nr:M23 family metallopeptidase [Mycobacteriaceae bacterium]
MRLRSSLIAVVAVLVLTSCGTGSQPGSAPSSPSTVTVTAGPPTPTPPPMGPTAVSPIIGSVLAPPMPVPATDGKTHLAYELVLTNAGPQDVTLTSLAAMSAGTRLLTLAGDELGHWTRVLGNPTPTATMRPAETALVWLDVAVDGANVPTEITHTVDISLAQPQPPLTAATMTETIAPTTPDNRQPVTISPPLSGDNWVDANGCCEMTPHRMAVSPLNGQLWAPERYAIDYIRLTPDGRLFNGDKNDLQSYPTFGADVLAVADGPTVAVVDDLPEQPPGANPVGLPLDQYAGNRVIEDIGGGNYVMYAHLKSGSVKVKVGDRLTAGQVLAAVGNSGNTDGPHLHFQVMSEPEPLRANGLPFQFDRFRLDSRLTPEGNDQVAAGGPAVFAPGVTAAEKTFAMPLYLDAMTYPRR